MSRGVINSLHLNHLARLKRFSFSWKLIIGHETGRGKFESSSFGDLGFGAELDESTTVIENAVLVWD